jgi:TolB-like protein/DNA-binding SARP family transcriptional activator
VSDSLAVHVSSRRYRLRTFGPPALLDADDLAFLGNHGHHRRRLALLAVLAAAGELGRTRDQLLVLFWPDVSESRARHSLDQLLYALRNSLGDSLFLGVNPIRLNHDVVRSDVAAFTAAVESGDLESAVEEYRAPFLEGFYLNGAPEFERWVEGERARLAASYAGALERLARDADSAGAHATAVRWWRSLVEMDPMSSRFATGLIGALANGGDRAAALQHAKRHESLVLQELGTNAAPAVTALVEEVRSSARPALEVPAPPLQRLPPAIAQPVPEGTRKSRRWPLVGAVGALVASLLVTAVWLASRTPKPVPAAGPPSIAVLPFTNLGNAVEDAALVDGLTEELITVLARIPALRVIPRTSAFAFRNGSLDVRRVADSLHVSNVLEGSVQKSGSHVRVQVRLVSAGDGSTRWSETYDREFSDVFTTQSDIAARVARELDLRLSANALGRIRRGSTRSVAAYEMYLRGSDPALTRSDSAANRGVEYFRQAIALDSGYAAAYAGFARLRMRSPFGEHGGVLPMKERFALARQAALKAIALDDSLGEAHSAMSHVRKASYDLAGAETEMKRAVALDPANARFREWLVQLYIISGQRTEALAEAQRALTLDPLSPTANAELAHALLANHRCDEALVQLERVRNLRPPLLRAKTIASQCYAQKGMWAEAIRELESLPATASTRGQGVLGYMLARGGRPVEARQLLARLIAQVTRSNGYTFDVALVYIGLGDNDQAFAWLDKAVDDQSLGLDLLPSVLNELSGDPRFARLQQRLRDQAQKR